jgi:hypothetical protein
LNTAWSRIGVIFSSTEDYSRRMFCNNCEVRSLLLSTCFLRKHCFLSLCLRHKKFSQKNQCMQQKILYKNINILLDKLSVWGRSKAYRRLWNSLGIGGIWMSSGRVVFGGKSGSSDRYPEA